MAARDQLADQRHHVSLAVGPRQHEFSGSRLEARRKRAQGGCIGVELRGGLFGHAPDRLVQRQARKIPCGAVVDLVVDVGDVAHVSDVVRAIEVPQQAEQHVEHDHRARVADMGKIVDRRSADIHADIVRIERHEGPLFPGQGIVQAQLHGYPVCLPAGRPVISL